MNIEDQSESEFWKYLAGASTSVLIGSAYFGAGTPAGLSLLAGVATTFGAIHVVDAVRGNTN